MSATKARKGSTAYCTSLAASFMLQECLKLELAQHAILVTNAIPGPVNTRMLQVGMAADVDVFPDSAEYGALRKEGKLIEPETVGRFYASTSGTSETRAIMMPGLARVVYMMHPKCIPTIG
jgi:NAD(P)-dependent dehydrogenase (short-subunit alcohol dehydrogenase family)